VRWLVGLLVLLIPAAFFFGRETRSNTTQTPLGTSTPILEYTMREDDTVRFPSAATRCEATQEGGVPTLFCRRDPEGRHQVVFSRDTIFVFRVGDPDNPQVFRWKP
jgi:hypothetical protein